MASIGGLLGTAGGMNGTGIAAPTNPTDPTQLANAYNNAQSGLTQQQNFANAVNPGGTQALQSQQQLLQQLQAGAQGQGPNPALAQLNQTTGQNVAAQNALMAGQRGSTANAGLMARQAAQQGANTQQQAVGQGATLAAQQQLAQEQALQAQQAQMVGQQANATNAYSQSAQGEQGNLLGATAAANGNRTQLIGQTMGGQQNMIGNLTSATGSAMGLAEGGQVPQMYAQGTVDAGGALQAAPTLMPSTPKTAGPQSKVGQLFQSSGQAPQSAPLTGASQIGNTLGKGIGTGLNALFGGAPSGSATNRTDDQTQEDYLHADSALGVGGYDHPETGAGDFMTSGLPAMAAHGGRVPALLSPGERKLSPKEAMAAASGKINPMAAGAKVPGKPAVGGAKNDYANDTVKASLKPGDVILPRSVTMSKDAEKKAVQFLQAVMAKHGNGLKKGSK